MSKEKLPALTREQIITRFTRLQMLKRTSGKFDNVHLYIYRPDMQVKATEKLYKKRVKSRLNTMAKKAKANGWPMPTMGRTDIILLLQERTCFYSGLYMPEHAITFDRVDNTIGYDRGNVVSCLKEFNILKSVFFEDDVNPKYIGKITDYTLEFVRETLMAEYILRSQKRNAA